MTDSELDEYIAGILAEIADDEDRFVADVKVGDRVVWKEWVWDRSITLNPEDPEVSEQVQFTGVVLAVGDGRLRVDETSVTPVVRQKPQCCLPTNCFRFAPAAPEAI